MEFLNTKLLRELDVASESAERFMKYYEKERRKRKLTEEMCDELEKQIGKDKANLEKLMRDSIKMYKEVEEEREMMRMTEQLREERVQMKLADAKDMLEEKYNQMVELIAYLQTFLRSRGDEVSNNEIEDARLIEQAVESVNIRQILELSYNFSKSDDNVFPIYEECSEKASMESLKQGNSTNHNINPHITRRMQGCIEWPKCIPKSNSKVIPLEERVKNQKSQLNCNIILSQRLKKAFV
jgi:predicted phage tail protein